LPGILAELNGSHFTSIKDRDSETSAGKK
jgi:hypothetical protein